MTQLHKQIYQDFLDKLGQTESEFAQTHGAMLELDYEGFCRYIFTNWTSLQPSYRLTNIGFLILSRMYQFWEFDISKQPFNTFNIPKVHIHLYRNVKSPYHYTPKSFHLFHSERALELEMAGGDILVWAEMFS